MADMTFWGEASVGEVQGEIARGTSLDAGDDGRSPLHEAAAYNTVEVVKLLVVEQKLDINAQDDNGDTPLHLAAESNPDPGIATLLLDQGAEVNAMNKKGETPLHKAVTSSDEPFARALLERGAEVNAKDERGETPLHKAAASSEEPLVVKALLEYGADRDARTNEGHTACWLAVSRGNDADKDMRLMLCTTGMSIREILKMLDIRDREVASIMAQKPPRSRTREMVESSILRQAGDPSKP